MIVFHEGLPRSGKSYEALKEHIIPALKAGKKVISNIDGVNLEEIAKYLGVPPYTLEDLFQSFFIQGDMDAQKKKLYSLVKAEEGFTTDTLVVIDEIQILFPSERNKLPEHWIEWISEHGHHGCHVVLIGQDRRDCHNLWRRRIQRVISFSKNTALGKEDSYRWDLYEARRPEKYIHVSGGSKKYDPAIYPCYKSHSHEDVNKENYSDSRAVVWKDPKLQMAFAGFLLLVAGGVYGVANFLHVEKPPEPVHTTQDHFEDPGHTIRREENRTLVSAADPVPSDPFQWVLEGGNLVHFAGAFGNYYYFQIYDRNLKMVDVFTSTDLSGYGYTIRYQSRSATINKGSYTKVIRRLQLPQPEFESTNNGLASIEVF